MSCKTCLSNSLANYKNPHAISKWGIKKSGSWFKDYMHAWSVVGRSPPLALKDLNNWENIKKKLSGESFLRNPTWLPQSISDTKYIYIDSCPDDAHFINSHLSFIERVFYTLYRFLCPTHKISMTPFSLFIIIFFKKRAFLKAIFCLLFNFLSYFSNLISIFLNFKKRKISWLFSFSLI